MVLKNISRERQAHLDGVGTRLELRQECGHPERDHGRPMREGAGNPRPRAETGLRLVAAEGPSQDVAIDGHTEGAGFVDCMDVTKQVSRRVHPFRTKEIAVPVRRAGIERQRNPLSAGTEARKPRLSGS